MQTTSVKLHSLRYADAPHLPGGGSLRRRQPRAATARHAVHMGGPTWLPIYFFTLVGAYKYGWRVGLLTALASPLLNSVLFGMPLPAMLPAIVLKSLLLAGAAGFAARTLPPRLAAAARGRRARLSGRAGSLGEGPSQAALLAAAQDFRIGLPGMLLQVVGGWAVIHLVIRR